MGAGPCLKKARRPRAYPAAPGSVLTHRRDRLGAQSQPLAMAMMANAAAKLHSAITTPHWVGGSLGGTNGGGNGLDEALAVPQQVDEFNGLSRVGAPLRPPVQARAARAAETPWCRAADRDE